MGAKVHTVIVETPEVTLAFTPKESWGDNPRFYASQVDEMLDDIKRQARALLEAQYGPQTTERS